MNTQARTIERSLRVVSRTSKVNQLDHLSQELKQNLKKFQQLADGGQGQQVLPLLLAKEMELIDQLMDAHCQFYKNQQPVN